MAPRKKAEVGTPPKAKVRRSAEVAPEVKNQLTGEPLKFNEHGQPLNYLSKEKDVGPLPFNEREPLRIKYTLFGKEREEFDCGGAISACIKPDEDGKVAVMTSVMGIADPEVLVMMLKSMMEHVAEVLAKIALTDKAALPKILNQVGLMQEHEKELIDRLSLSRMATSRTQH